MEVQKKKSVVIGIFALYTIINSSQGLYTS